MKPMPEAAGANHPPALNPRACAGHFLRSLWPLRLCCEESRAPHAWRCAQAMCMGTAGLFIGISRSHSAHDNLAATAHGQFPKLGSYFGSPTY